MSSERFERGLGIRREVLGDAYVDNALKSATEFTQPLQELISEHAWCDIWSRDALPRPTRSLVTIGILAALKAPNELKVHVLGALRNGCSVEEIQEVLLQIAVYCGAPAGIEAFKAAKEVVEAWQEGETD